MKGRAKIFVVDDHPVVCAGLAALISQESDLIVCGQATSASQALRGIGVTKPDLAIVGLSLRNSSGLELIKELQNRHPSVRILVLSMWGDVNHVERALRAGAAGYVDKQDTLNNIVTAMRRAMRGRRYITNKLAERLLDNRVRGSDGEDELQRFSDRELEVFELLARGCGTGYIAAALHISVKTVQTYCERVKRKLGARTGRELLVEAGRWRERQPDA